MAYTKTNWQNLPNQTTPVNATNLNKIENQLETITNGLDLIADGYVAEADLTATDGYIRYENGLQIAWKSATVIAGGTLWGGTGIYYSDHSLGNWAAAFTNIFNATSNVKASQFWTTCEAYTTTSAGSIRAFRPNSSTQSVVISIIGIGLWK